MRSKEKKETKKKKSILEAEIMRYIEICIKSAFDEVFGDFEKKFK